MSAFTNGLPTAGGGGFPSSSSGPKHDRRASESMKLSNSTTTKTTTAPGKKSSKDEDEAVAALLKPLDEATNPTDMRAALSALHGREAALTRRLDGLAASHADLNRDLLRLDGLRATLGAQVIASRTISNAMLAGAAETASRLSGRVRQLDLEKARVRETLGVVEQVAELKACVAGVTGSMGAPQDWEAAARYLARAAAVPEGILRCGFANAVVPTVETPDSPAETLEAARESLRVLFLREFDRAAADGDDAKVTRFFKLFPLIGRGDVGLDVYGRYVCQGVAGHARATLKEGAGAGGGSSSSSSRRDGLFYAAALTKLFEHVAEIVAHHGGLVERHYGSGKMVRVIERLQAEVDVQGGIVLDAWADERSVDRRLTDVRSYPFSFLVQSFLPQQRQGAFGGTPRVNSPAPGGGGGGGGGPNNQRSSEDEGVNMKEVDGLLTEIAFMLGKWSLYSRFMAAKCKDPEADENTPLVMPQVLTKSNLHGKVSSKLTNPYNVMSTFYFRRSVEKAFQLDESPPGLSLSMSRPLEGNPPYIISAVDDVMYMANTVLQRTLATSQVDVVSSVVPTVGRVLGSDFVGMIQRRMRDETYPQPVVQGGLPPEDRIVGFVVLINTLDMAKEYLSRIISGRLGVSASATAADDDGDNRAASDPRPPPPAGSLADLFPLDRDAATAARELRSLDATFSSKAGDLLREGVDVLFGQVVRPRLRPVLGETFRDADYSLSEADLLELAAQEDEDEGGGGGGGGGDGVGVGVSGGHSAGLLAARLEQVGRRFEQRWNALMQPLCRLMTPRTYSSLLDATARYLARMLEKRVWLSAGKVNEFGAVRMERDFSAIVSAVARGNYALREAFARVSQALMVANMEEDEWEELVAEEEERGGAGAGAGEGGMQWVLSEEDRRRARNLVRGS